VAVKKKKKKVVCRKRRRRTGKAGFATAIASLLDEVEDEYRGETPNAAYYSAITVVAGAFVWAINRGCPPSALTNVMTEALNFALQSEGLHPAVMIEVDREQRDPKEVN
jgi:hypothetical protein